MWDLLPAKTRMTVAVVAIAALLGTAQLAYTYATGQPSSPWQWTSAVVTLLLALAATVGNTIWFWLARRVPAMQTSIFPDLNGKWAGQLQSTFIDKETGRQVPSIDVTVTIRQTLLGTTVRLETITSLSKSVRVFLDADRENKRYVVHHFYANDPNAQARQQLAPHLGMASLQCDWDEDRDRLTGRYFTDRKTTGDIEVRRVGDRPGSPSA